MKQGIDLRGLVGYQIQRAHLAMSGDARAALAPHGISPAKLTALILIRDNPGCGQTALARALAINRSSSMKLVNILVDRGLIERRSGRDLRTNALYVTANGGQQAERMLEEVRRSDARMIARLNAEEARTLTGLLRKLGSPSGKSVRASGDTRD